MMDKAISLDTDFNIGMGFYSGLFRNGAHGSLLLYKMKKTNNLLQLVGLIVFIGISYCVVSRCKSKGDNVGGGTRES